MFSYFLSHSVTASFFLFSSSLFCVFLFCVQYYIICLTEVVQRICRKENADDGEHDFIIITVIFFKFVVFNIHASVLSCYVCVFLGHDSEHSCDTSKLGCVRGHLPSFYPCGQFALPFGLLCFPFKIKCDKVSCIKIEPAVCFSFKM